MRANSTSNDSILINLNGYTEPIEYMLRFERCALEKTVTFVSNDIYG